MSIIHAERYLLPPPPPPPTLDGQFSGNGTLALASLRLIALHIIATILRWLINSPYQLARGTGSRCTLLVSHGINLFLAAGRTHIGCFMFPITATWSWLCFIASQILACLPRNRPHIGYICWCINSPYQLVRGRAPAAPCWLPMVSTLF